MWKSNSGLHTHADGVCESVQTHADTMQNEYTQMYACMQKKGGVIQEDAGCQVACTHAHPKQ